MKICVFCGTFNPIHLGHLQIAYFVKTNCSFEKIIFIPSNKSPFKLNSHDIATQRLEMVKLAIKDMPFCEVDEIEFKSQGISYTYYTVLKLYEKYDIDGKINFIIGDDAFLQIQKWYKSNELKKLVKFILLPRNLSLDCAKLKHLENEGFEFELLNMKRINLSSTLIRDKIKSEESIEGLVTKEVEKYIYENKLYGN